MLHVVEWSFFFQACGHFVVTPQLMTKAKPPKQMVVMHPLPRVDEIRFVMTSCYNFD
jgi:aspartate carbamoyltransferase catalytic subunit